MIITDILSSKRIITDFEAKDKRSVITEISSLLIQKNEELNGIFQNQLESAFLDRENLGSTGIGNGIAIPHAKINQLEKQTACLLISPRGVPFDAIDSKPVNFIFALLVSKNSHGTHLKALARISRILHSDNLRDKIITLKNAKEIYKELIKYEENF